MKKIKKDEFFCEEKQIVTTIKKCLKHCKKDGKSCAEEKIMKQNKIIENFDKRELIAKLLVCPKCGSDYIIVIPECHLCGSCGHPFEID